MGVGSGNECAVWGQPLLSPLSGESGPRAERVHTEVADERYATSGSYYSWGGEAGTGGSGGKDAVENKDKELDWFMNYGSFRTLSVDEIGGEAADDARCQKLWDLSERLVQTR